MKPLVYYYLHGLSSDTEARLETSFQELQRLMKLPPLEVECPIARLPEGLEAEILSDLQHEKFNICVCHVSDTLCRQIGTFATANPNRRILPRLIVCCEKDNPVARRCLSENPLFRWGVASSPLAVVYKLDRLCAVWHELLHLLGAKDCYKMDNEKVVHYGPTCEHPECIMQYAAPRGVVDGRLPLCQANANRIRCGLAKIKEC